MRVDRDQTVSYSAIIHDENVFELLSSLAPWELAPRLPVSSSRLHTVVVAAGSVGAGSLAPWELSSYLRTVVVGAGSL